MNGKKAKALRRLAKEMNPQLPERELKQYVDKRTGRPPPDWEVPSLPRVNKPNTQHAKYQGLKANYKRQMAQ